ncbi:hypothetical protein GW835_03865 [archaeon]|nr:hypothetical protein [archaeon]NCP79674.1 hypothetical protein [archaeon]NCP97964.1 hypothetical protein [archaeon]NCQ07440.1 hypothetical protein [archaeon]NCQ51231.1 hypothetical protein [archaeon]
MKKAISPIIATILLIVVSLALVAILLSWGSDFVTKNTSEADNAVNKECVGAYIDFVSCIYNVSEETITASFINSGNIDFDSDYNFNVTIIDNAKQVDFSNNDVLDSNGLSKGESNYFIIEDYNGVRPIKVQLRSTQCPLSYWETKCS